jgi:hypothetical protein
MKRRFTFFLVLATAIAFTHSVSALSLTFPQPQIFFPEGYDTNRAEQVHSVLRSDRFKYLDGMTSYWPPEWSTILVYDGDSKSLTALIAALKEIKGLSVRLTFSDDLSKETGSALQAGSWWVKYSHTTPDTITVRINLAADSLGRDKFDMTLPKAKS